MTAHSNVRLLPCTPANYHDTVCKATVATSASMTTMIKTVKSDSTLNANTNAARQDCNVLLNTIQAYPTGCSYMFVPDKECNDDEDSGSCSNSNDNIDNSNNDNKNIQNKNDDDNNLVRSKNNTDDETRELVENMEHCRLAS
uniref:Uncharacterized protein n=1 Tax=Lygus hesperus TaxID=30085 RepID=A0A0A9XZM0_LYGHE